jgi:hypothetical protein
MESHPVRLCSGIFPQEKDNLFPPERSGLLGKLFCLLPCEIGCLFLFLCSNKGMKIDGQTARLSPQEKGGPDLPVEIDNLCGAENFQDKDQLFPQNLFG